MAMPAPTLGSLWREAAPPAPDCPALEGRIEAEVAIVGAGFTGLSAALALAERGRRVVVLEAEEPGAGASGASGGQVIPGLKHFPEDLHAAYGREAGERIFAFAADAADRTFALVGRHGIACDADRGGWIQAADTPTALAEGEARARAWMQRGAPVELLSREELIASAGSPAYLGGWIDRRGGAVNPLALARGLAAAAQQAGAIVHGGSPCTGLARHGAEWRLGTPRGEVRARRLLLAANAAVGRLAPEIGRSQLTVWSYQIATRPLPGAGLFAGAAAVSDTRRVLRYFRRDAAGRIVVGGKGKGRAPAGIGDFDLQRRMLGALFPGHANAPIDHAWGGEIAIALDRLPRLYSIGPDAYAAQQDNGKGVAWCVAAGEPLAALLDGEDWRSLPLPPPEPARPIPFHGLRAAYVAAGNAWLRFRDRLDGAAA